MYPRYPLTALRAFETAARTGSFAGAADELSVTRPAISKQIRLLEEELACDLFERGHGATTLTRVGEELHAGLKQSFDLIAETMARVRAHASGRETLRILVDNDFASSWLAGSIGSFLVNNPGLSVEIVAERNGIMRLDEDYDCRIFYVDPAQSVLTGFKGRTLCRWIDLPLCSPDYFKLLSGGEEEQVKQVHLLHDRSTEAWRNWLEIAGLTGQVDLDAGTIFNETSLCLSAAMTGAGVAIGDSFVAFDSLRNGDLVPPFSSGLRKQTAYILYRRNGVTSSRGEAAFEEWIVEALSEYMGEVEQLLSGMGVNIES